jgi:hypothetical protein
MNLQSKLSRTDLTAEQKLMWKKLSTVPKPKTTMFPWQSLGRGFRKGEMVVIHAKSNDSKSIIDVESNYYIVKRLDE